MLDGSVKSVDTDPVWMGKILKPTHALRQRDADVARESLDAHARPTIKTDSVATIPAGTVLTVSRKDHPDADGYERYGVTCQGHIVFVAGVHLHLRKPAATATATIVASPVASPVATPIASPQPTS